MTLPLEIAATLWKASNALRTGLDPAATTECMLAIFFLKYVSDAERDSRPTKSKRFVVPPGANFYTLLDQCTWPGNAERLEQALMQLEQANPAKLKGLFTPTTFGSTALRSTSMLDKTLSEALTAMGSRALHLSGEPTGESDAVSGFEFLLQQLTLVSNSVGELYTPPQVSRLMAQFVDPRPGDALYDPACGSGSLLLTCANLIRERYNSRDYMLSAQERGRVPWKLSKMNAFLHGEDNHRFVCGDTLRNPLLLRDANTLERFDVVVANPPFSVSDWGSEFAEHDPFGRFQLGVPPRARADYAFILHMIASMQPETGRMAMVAPHGALFRGGSEGEIRRNLIDRNVLDAVVGLPPKIFYNTVIPTVILIFRAKRDDNHVLFIDASRDFGVGRRRNELRGQDIDRIIAAYKKRATIEDFAKLVSHDEIEANAFNLNLSLYLKVAAATPVIDMESLAARQQQLTSELTTIRQDIDAGLQQLGQKIGVYDSGDQRRTPTLLEDP